MGRSWMLNMKPAVLLGILCVLAVQALAQQDTVIINESTFKIRLAGNRQKMVYRGNPAFYRDTTGIWKNIDPNWKMSGDSLAYVRTGVYAAWVDTLGNVKVRFKGREIGWRLQGLVYFDESNKNRQVIRAANWKRPISKKDSLIFENIFPGVDYALRYHPRTLLGYLKISAAARAALPTPASLGIPASNAWLCLVYKMDLSDLKDFFEGADSVQWIDRFDTHNPVIIKQSPDSVWGLFPQEIIYTTDTTFGTPLLRKTFLKTGTDFLMILGYEYDDFVNLPSGEVIFDEAVQIKGTNKIIDSYLSKPSPTTNYGSSASSYMGRGATSNDIFRSVIKWDFSDIPSGSTITAAVDSHYYDLGSSCTNVSQDFDLYRLTRLWDEAEVSWNYAQRNPDVSWTTSGGDYSDLIISTSVGYPNGWLTVSGLETAVQNWLDGTWSNYGCIWRHTDETGNNSCKVFYTSEHATNDSRLYLTYTLPSAFKSSRRSRLVRMN